MTGLLEENGNDVGLVEGHRQCRLGTETGMTYKVFVKNTQYSVNDITYLFLLCAPPSTSILGLNVAAGDIVVREQVRGYDWVKQLAAQLGRVAFKFRG